MTSFRQLSLIAIAWFLSRETFGANANVGPAETAATAVVWQRWEGRLAGERNNAPATADIYFQGPGGKSLQVPAFAVGDGTIGFRVAFPAPGVWRWRSRDGDAQKAGLDGQTGEVRVAPYRGTNPLFRHGDLRVSANRRYLVHADETPFLWLGDTCWNGIWKSSLAEWRDYIDTRARQHFSVVQVIAAAAVPTGEAQELPECGRLPFTTDGAPDPAYWSDLDTKVAFANERGLFVMLTGLGKSRGPFTEAQNTLAFARYVAGRYAGDMVIISPSMDQRFEPVNEEQGLRLRPLTTHLVTQHPGTHRPTAERYHDATYTDFTGLQTGHQSGRLDKVYDAAHEWTLGLWRRQSVKPVINIEAMYDALGHDAGPAWREKDARRLGWISWLSGSRGYTYGAGDIPPKVPNGGGGIWRFQENEAAYDYWRKALRWPSATQMTILRDFFVAIEWWRLEPAPESVMDPAAEPPRKIAVSRSASGDLWVSYLPDNPEVLLNLDIIGAGMTGTWFNPVTGHELPVTDPIASGRCRFRRPDGWEDAVLTLKTKR